MIKALSLAAALALLPLSASAQTPRSSEAAIEAAAEAFEARMEAFGERAEAIDKDASLTDAQREFRIAALWTEYQPDVTAFTAVVTEHAAVIAGEALAEIDINALVADALEGVEVSGALNAARGIATNGAWASNDPEHMATYGLMAEYALGEAMDSLEGVEAEVAAAVEASSPALTHADEDHEAVETPDEG